MSSTTPLNPAPTAYSYIRFSTVAQIDGDSLRRQMAASIAYANKHGLKLDDTLTLRDLGVSAFRGANAERGQLRAFLRAIESGRVAPGSYLLVESLDRLSRDKVSVALTQFMDIINAGIVLVTLMDDRVYSAASVNANFTDLIISITVMSRAHEESLAKSKRRAETWNEQKRKAAASLKPITRKLPFWLDCGEDGFTIQPEAADTVLRVFELARAGMGYWKIAQTLNAEGVLSPAARTYTRAPKNGGDRLWGSSSVSALLQNESVLGHLVMKEAVVKPEDAPVPSRIDGYYPRVIDDELFYAVKGQRPGPKGRSSPLKTNLFTGLLFCGYCEGPCQVDTRTKNGARSSTIRCTRKRKGLPCRFTSWSYEKFEMDFFRFVTEANLSEIVQPKRLNTELEREIAELVGRLVSTNHKLANLLNSLETEGATQPKLVLDLIEQRTAERDALSLELRAKEVLFDSERSYKETAERDAQALRDQFATLNGLPTADQLVVRYSIAEHVATVVESIYLQPIGSLWWTADGADDDLPDAEAWKAPDRTPSFIVHFRSGWSGFITPSTSTSSRMDFRELDIPGMRRIGHKQPPKSSN